MIQCTKCGQGNSHESNFCRFCGNRFFQTKQSNSILQNGNNNSIGNGNSYDFSPRRPYSWKTDEFQIEESTSRKTDQINRVEPFSELNRTATYPTQMQNPLPQTPPQPLTHYQQSNMAYGYRCPRCATQLLPRIDRKISSVGWIVFTVLLVTFFPLFWIGLLIKEDVRICPVCNLKVS